MSESEQREIFIIPCTYCKEPQERSMNWQVVCCHACKMKRMKERQKKPVNKIRKQMILKTARELKEIRDKEFAQQTIEAHENRALIRDMNREIRQAKGERV